LDNKGFEVLRNTKTELEHQLGFKSEPPQFSWTVQAFHYLSLFQMVF